METQLEKLETTEETLGVRVMDGASNKVRDKTIIKDNASSQARRDSTGKNKDVR